MMYIAPNDVENLTVCEIIFGIFKALCDFPFLNDTS